MEGVLEGTDLACYYAIPFAAPPVGDLRWKEPQPAKPWAGVLKAKETAKWPPQPEKSYVKYDMMDEDCLYLSVVTPAKTVSEALPVMVFIHGGGFRTEHYGGELWQSLARRGVVTVSVAYRAGALGYLAHADLAKENPEGHSGNYGMLDLIFALQWVQRNIQNFGGDPAKVAIFGESAGAISCNILCASPLAKGLFRACISESGAFMSPLSLIDQATAQMLGYLFMNQLQKKGIDELRQMDAKSLTGNDVNFQGSTPIIDGYVMTAPLRPLSEGRIQRCARLDYAQQRRGCRRVRLDERRALQSADQFVTRQLGRQLENVLPRSYRRGTSLQPSRCGARLEFRMACLRLGHLVEADRQESRLCGLSRSEVGYYRLCQGQPSWCRPC